MNEPPNHIGPYTSYAVPGRMLVTGLSNDKDHGGRTALVEYTNDGDYIATHWMPTSENTGGAAVVRLQRSAALLGPHVASRAEAELVGDLSLKGLHRPVTVYNIQGLKET